VSDRLVSCLEAIRLERYLRADYYRGRPHVGDGQAIKAEDGALMVHMHGGQVIEVAHLRAVPHVLFVDCAARADGRLHTRAIMLASDHNSERVQIGDFLWWDANAAYWTPHGAAHSVVSEDRKAGVHFDIPLYMVGLSGVIYPYRDMLRR
jgi:hypothetical protein